MRNIYIPDKNTYQYYKSHFQSGAGFNPQGYIFSTNQSGSGLGGFLRSVVKFATPLAKKVLYKGWNLAKPELKKIGGAAIAAGERKLTQKTAQAVNKLNNYGKAKTSRKRKSIKPRKVTKKRKVDALGS